MCFWVEADLQLLVHQTQSATTAGNYQFVLVRSVSACVVLLTDPLTMAFSSGTVGGGACRCG